MQRSQRKEAQAELERFSGESIKNQNSKILNSQQSKPFPGI
jgi:hypothetical protein